MMKAVIKMVNFVAKVLIDDTKSMFFLLPTTEGSQSEVKADFSRNTVFLFLELPNSLASPLYTFLANFIIEARLMK